MSLVPKDQMTELFSASTSANTAANAEDDIQLKSVAYAINEAANTGLYRVVYQTKLRPNVKAQLESQGYKIKYIDNNSYNMEHHALIIWGPTTAADDISEPSLNGPQHSNYPND